jgi:L-cysteine:1D-myo-inositol 2-amino-2-deoxy-alpha-D-glucopyranoside ligase
VKIYNSLTQEIEVFLPRGDEVSIYGCGITPYDTTHLGHAFTYISIDILIRYLESQGLKVVYVQNVTDIDDDILRKAKEVGDDWRVVGNRWTAHYINDMKTLNVRAPDYFPRATEYIDEIIVTVKDLLEADVAYESDGSVYFNVDSWPEFGKLSRLSREDMLPIANERGNIPDDPNKRDPLDFVLWQAQAPGEPAWDSPWGPGRPGWHIECSTMSTRLLGSTIDFHSGGGDLSFPHHECEIAQVEPVTGQKPFVRYWIHVAMVHHDGEKMSKSLGNLIMVDDLLQNWTPDALRLYLGCHHYRDVWSYDEKELKLSAEMSERCLSAIRADGGGGNIFDGSSHWVDFKAAMDDDLDTPTACKVMLSLANEILQASESNQHIESAQQLLRDMATIFGLSLSGNSPEERVIEGWNEQLRRFM